MYPYAPAPFALRIATTLAAYLKTCYVLAPPCYILPATPNRSRFKNKAAECTPTHLLPLLGVAPPFCSSTAVNLDPEQIEPRNVPLRTCFLYSACYTLLPTLH